MSQTTHNTLGTNEWLLSGNSLWSTDGSVEFKMQGDGKIAVYWVGGNRSGFLPFQSIFCCLRSRNSLLTPETRINFSQWSI